MAIRIGMIGGL